MLVPHFSLPVLRYHCRQFCLLLPTAVTCRDSTSMYSVQICHQMWLLSLHLWDLSLQGSHLGSASTCLVACFDLQCLTSFVVFFIWKGHAFERHCFSCTACNIFTLLTYSIMQAIINTVINKVMKGYRFFTCGLKTAAVYFNAFPWFGREAESSGKSETDVLVSDISLCTCTWWLYTLGTLKLFQCQVALLRNCRRSLQIYKGLLWWNIAATVVDNLVLHLIWWQGTCCYSCLICQWSLEMVIHMHGNIFE